MDTDRFIHEGRPLATWLLQLVADSPRDRQLAANVITEHFYMPRALLGEPHSDSAAIVEEFNSAVRRAVNQPEFPATAYVNRLFSLSMALEAKRISESAARNKEDDAWHREQVAKLGSNPTPEQVSGYSAQAWGRLRQQMEPRLASPPEETIMTVVTLSYIIAALGVELLPATALIRRMLNETHQASVASGAICRMGLAAREFHADLISGLQRDDFNWIYSKPLGVLLQHDSSLIPGVFGLLDSSNPKARINAMIALACCGRETLREFPAIEAKLRERMTVTDGYERGTCVWALGELAVSLESVALLLQATYPPDGDLAGIAISSLGKIGLDAERIVPRLVQSIDDYTELDPDLCYQGSHSRVIEALKGYGTHARIAIPRLARRIWMDPPPYYYTAGVRAESMDLDQDVIKYLGSWGTAAREALPALLAARAAFIRREVAAYSGNPAEIPNEDELCPDYLTEAINRIRGT